jgi:hypothetical protein
MSKLGIEQTKEVLGLGLSVGQLIAGLSDGIGIKDIGALVSVIKRVPSAISAIKSGQIIPELKDLEDSEKSELKSYVSANFDIDDDKIEAAVEAGLYVAIDLSDLIKVI